MDMTKAKTIIAQPVEPEISLKEHEQKDDETNGTVAVCFDDCACEQ